MYKNYLRIITLVVIFFLFGLFPSVSFAEDETKQTSAEIPPVSNEGVTIVLRAPMSKNCQVLKFAVGEDGKVNEGEDIKGLRVYLPTNTSVFFRVDQVNTVLYNVEISVEKQVSTVDETSGQSDSVGIISLINRLIKEALAMILNPGVADSEKKVAALGRIEVMKQKMKELNEEFETILYQSEMPQFSNYEIIKTQAKKATKNKFSKKDDPFCLEKGTSKELSKKIIEAVTEVHKELTGSKKTRSERSAESDENSKKEEFTEVYEKTLKRLRMIETATWRKDDKQVCILENEITYKCVISPALKLSGSYPELKTENMEIRISGERKLSGPYFTTGPFWTGLSDEHYIKKAEIINDKNTHIIAKGIQDRYSVFGGVLAHFPFTSKNTNNIRTAAAFSVGLGLSNVLQSDGSSKLREIPVTLGVSGLFAGKKDDSLFAITMGVISKPLERLDGYVSRDEYPSVDKITRPVRRNGFFISITVSSDIMNNIKLLMK